MTNGPILLIEDNEDDITLTLRAFKKNKILNEIVVTRDGKEAIEYLSTVTELPALVLLDLKLPFISGIEILRRIREAERTSLLPVVVLTSSKEERDVFNSYKLRANSFIRKPVDFDKFVSAAREIGVYWLVLNEPPPPVESISS